MNDKITTTKQEKSFAEELKELHLSLMKDNMRAEQMKRMVLIPPISDEDRKDAEWDEDTYAWDFLSSKDPEFSVVYTKDLYGEIREVSNKKIHKDIDIYKETIQESINAFFEYENFDIVKRMQKEPFQRFMNWVCDTDDSKITCEVSFEPVNTISNNAKDMMPYYEKYEEMPCYALKDLISIATQPIENILYELMDEDEEPFKDLYSWRETKSIGSEIIGWAHEIVIDYFKKVKNNFDYLYETVYEKTVYQFPNTDIIYKIEMTLSVDNI
jgi:hypothetical protein